MHSIFTRLRRRGFETALVVISALALGGIAVAPAQAVEAGLASFTVVVVDHAGDPVSAELRLTSASGMVVGVEPTIGATGAFEFTGLKVGNYSLRVESVEPLFVSWPSNAYQGDVTLVEGVNPNQRVVLDRLATLSGRVTGKSLNGSAPTPLEGVVVSSSFESAKTDANGDFHLATRPGDVRLRFQPSPSSSYSAVYYGGAKDYWDAQIVSASEGAKIAGLDVTLELTSEISGTVSAAAGAPLGETSVNAFELVSGNWRNVGWATTDADGEYTLKVAAGSYRVGFNLYSTSTSNATEYFDDVKTIDDAKDLVVGGGLALAGINAELAPLVTPPTEPTTPPTTPTTPVTPPTTPTTPVTPPAIGDSGPQNTVPATTVGQDGSVLVTGSGFQPFEEVVIWLHSTPVKLGTLIADKSGNISGRMSIPAGTPAGTHHIVLVDAAGTSYQSAAVTVTTAADAAPAPTPVTSSDVAAVSATASALANTGVRVNPMLLGALAALIVLSGAALLAIRNRRETSSSVRSR